jgi:hypothetical protein
MAPLFACLTLSARVQAVTPAPDGGYPDGNTLERDTGLFGSQAGRDKRPLAIKLKKADKALVTKARQQPPGAIKDINQRL